MVPGHRKQVAPWMERLDLPVLNLGHSAMRSKKNESMLFVNH